MAVYDRVGQGHFTSDGDTQARLFPGATLLWDQCLSCSAAERLCEEGMRHWHAFVGRYQAIEANDRVDLVDDPGTMEAVEATFGSRLQPVRDMWDKQIQLWKELILDCCRTQKIFVIGLEEEFPSFSNPAIERSLSHEAREAFLSVLISDGRAEWLGKRHVQKMSDPRAPDSRVGQHISELPELNYVVFVRNLDTGGYKFSWPVILILSVGVCLPNIMPKW